MKKLSLPQISEQALLLLSATYLTFATNRTLGSFVAHLEFSAAVQGALFKFSVVALSIGILALGLLPFYWLKLTKPAIAVFVFVAAIGDFFMREYGILIDGPTAQSVIETTSSESIQFLNFNFFLYMFLFAGLYILFVIFIPLKKITFKTRSLYFAKGVGLCVVLVMLIGATFYKEYASFFRNNRQVRWMFNPINSIYEGGRYAKVHLFPRKTGLTPIGLDAHRIAVPSQGRRLFVFVLGETARTDHFSINGYAVPTNPRLSHEKIISFSDVASCGTSTATSLPCLFSHFGRRNFDVESHQNYENILDIVQRAGYKVTWIDNNTGCQGVCSRVHNVNPTLYRDSTICNKGGCHDELLVRALKDVVKSDDLRDQLVVLHMLGSHGPAYHMRYPPEFAAFKPECATSELIECTNQQVINSYDNTILYTDSILGSIIDYLKSLENRYETSMVYVSDHGESLGENRIYLHSLPYVIAPEAQKKVPLVFWFGDTFRRRRDTAIQFLKRNENCQVSHDQVFHSLFSLLEIASTEHKSTLDLMAPQFICSSRDGKKVF